MLEKDQQHNVNLECSGGAGVGGGAGPQRRGNPRKLGEAQCFVL